jgi:hypothetical protein
MLATMQPVLIARSQTIPRDMRTLHYTMFSVVQAFRFR